jgi:hypothetical protein
MAFEDVKDSIQWAKGGGPVHAYFAAHFASFDDDANKEQHDTVRYAIGYLAADGNRLAGDLPAVFANTATQTVVGSIDDPKHPLHLVGVNEGMEAKPRLSYRLEVYPDGTIGVQPKLDGKPIGGMPVEKLAGSAVSEGLLRAASSTTAFSVSLDRQAKPGIPK